MTRRIITLITRPLLGQHSFEQHSFEQHSFEQHSFEQHSFEQHSDIPLTASSQRQKDTHR